MNSFDDFVNELNNYYNTQKAKFPIVLNCDISSYFNKVNNLVLDLELSYEIMLNVIDDFFKNYDYKLQSFVLDFDFLIENNSKIKQRILHLHRQIELAKAAKRK